MRLAVFCGSSAGVEPEYMQAAKDLGNLLGAQNIGLVYGGAQVGLMGAVADATLEAGGEVIGVIPQQLADKEIAHKGLNELIVVADMHERKLKMAELSDGFIALPGGAGTLEEITEQWTWAQLGVHNKPCAFLNILNYYDSFKNFIDHSVQQGFTGADYGDMLIYEAKSEDVLTAIMAYTPPPPKWLGKVKV